MNRDYLRTLTAQRVKDARALLKYHRWAGAYHMIGYSLECSLKCCVLKHLDETGAIFTDKKYLEKLAKCWTHDLTLLLDIANLKIEFEIACGANLSLEANWGVAKDWTEISRYQLKTREEAEGLFTAITHGINGVLPWIQARW